MLQQCLVDLSKLFIEKKGLLLKAESRVRVGGIKNLMNMKSIKKFEGKKIDLSSEQKGGRSPLFGTETSQAWNGGTDATRGRNFKTNVDWNPFNNDKV